MPIEGGLIRTADDGDSRSSLFFGVGRVNSVWRGLVHIIAEVVEWHTRKFQKLVGETP